MAKKTADTVRMSFEIELKNEHIPVLNEMLELPEGVTATPVQKIRDMAEDLLTQMANGAVLFSPDEVKLVLESTGVQLSTAENLIPYITAESEMQDGFHRVVVMIDPANYPAYEELARTQERSVDSLMQEVVDMVQENEWVYELHPRPRQVLMTEAQAAELTDLLGGEFSTGADLYRLLVAKMAPAPEEDASSLFEETAEQEA